MLVRFKSNQIGSCSVAKSRTSTTQSRPEVHVRHTTRAGNWQIRRKSFLHKSEFTDNVMSILVFVRCAACHPQYMAGSALSELGDCSPGHSASLRLPRALFWISSALRLSIKVSCQHFPFHSSTRSVSVASASFYLCSRFASTIPPAGSPHLRLCTPAVYAATGEWVSDLTGRNCKLIRIYNSKISNLRHQLGASWHTASFKATFASLPVVVSIQLPIASR